MTNILHNATTSSSFHCVKCWCYHVFKHIDEGVKHTLKFFPKCCGMVKSTWVLGLSSARAGFLLFLWCFLKSSSGSIPIFSANLHDALIWSFISLSLAWNLFKTEIVERVFFSGSSMFSSSAYNTSASLEVFNITFFMNMMEAMKSSCFIFLSSPEACARVLAPNMSQTFWEQIKKWPTCQLPPRKLNGASLT